MLRRINYHVVRAVRLANGVLRNYTIAMTDEFKTNDAPTDDIQKLSQRFLKLWQEQMSLMAEGGNAVATPEEWMTHWNGMLQGGMPVGATQNMPSNMTPEFWASIIPGFSKNNDYGNDEGAGDEHKTRAWQTNGAAAVGAASIDTIDILRQLTSHIERLDQRLTRLEQQAVPSKSATKSGRSGKSPAKKPRGKSTKRKSG